MTFLPIVERELRVASRKRFTFWSRLAAAGFMLIIFGLFGGYMFMVPGASSMLGRVSFGVLSWIAFIFAAAMGVFIPSDSLSEEKREGTLGLLFLTDLRGHDVVFGKLCSLSLQSFYGLLASFPVIALPMLAGGVTVVEFWRAMLVICNTLFLSVAIGLLISSMSREGFKAMNGALLFSLLFLVGLPWLDWGIARWGLLGTHVFRPILSVASPGYLFAAAATILPGQFWLCLSVQHVIGWMLLAVACVIVPRSWHDKTSGNAGLLHRFSTAWRFGSAKGRLRFRQKWMDRDPLVWLALRDRWMPRFIIGLTVVLGALSAWESCESIKQTGSGISINPFMGSGAFQFLLNFGLELWMAVQASRLYLEAVRSGAMELMLVTPMTPAQIVRGQWRALVRIFLIPVIILVTLHLGTGIVQLVKQAHIVGKTTRVASNGNLEVLILQGIMLCSGTLNTVLGIAALAWFGMWMGLTNRKLSFAIVKTVVFVWILPWIAQMFLMMFGFAIFGFLAAKMFRGGGFSHLWIGMMPSALFNLAKNIFFIQWSRRRLLARFRETVVNGGRRAPRLVAAAVPVPAGAPPPPAPIGPAVS